MNGGGSEAAAEAGWDFPTDECAQLQRCVPVRCMGQDGQVANDLHQLAAQQPGCMEALVVLPDDTSITVRALLGHLSAADARLDLQPGNPLGELSGTGRSEDMDGASTVSCSSHSAPVQLHTCATLAMHPITGAFADLWHEAAFAAQLYRTAFACHVSLGALLLVGCIIWLSSVWMSPGLRAAWLLMVLCLALGLVGRVTIHRMQDAVLGQRIGSWTWAGLLTPAYTACPNPNPNPIPNLDRPANACLHRLPQP